MVILGPTAYENVRQSSVLRWDIRETGIFFVIIDTQLGKCGNYYKQTKLSILTDVPGL